MLPDEALQIIRSIATDTRNVGWSAHAREMMVERDISVAQVLAALRSGRLVGRPRLDEFND